MYKRNLRNNNGSSTIETTLIISAVLLVLAVLVYSFLIMYQKMLLTKTAQHIAQQGAAIWTDSKKSIYDGSKSEKNKDISLYELYYQLLDDSLFTGRKIREKIQISSISSDTINSSNGSTQEEKLSKMKKAIKDELAKGLLKPSSTYLEIDYSNILIQRRVDITITQEIRIPFGGLKSLLDGKETMTLTGAGTAAIIEPDEYIRNIDFISEYTVRSGALDNIGQKVNDLKGKLKGGNMQGGE